MQKSLALFVFFTVWLDGCGYTMRGQERTFFETKQIHTLYVPPVKNDSYKAGIEIILYNIIRRRFAQWGYLRIVDSPVGADAQLLATVQTASIEPTGVATASGNLPGANGTGGTYQIPPNVLIATAYNVWLKVKFDLKKESGAVLWSNIMVRNIGFKAATYAGPLGATSALINESQFDDSLTSLAGSVVFDVEESMSAIF